MGSLSNWAENQLLDHVFENTPMSVPTNLYVGLSTATIDDTTTGSTVTEPGDTYARVNHNSWDAATGRMTENTGTVTFPTATGSWGTITDWFVADQSTGGNIIAYGTLSEGKAVVSGNTPSFADGVLEISFSAGAIFNYLAHELLDHVFKVGSYAQPDIRVGLSTSTPNDDGTGITEPSGNNYSQVDFNDWTAASGGALSNNTVIQFPTPSASWGTVTYVVLFDSSANPLCYGDITDQAISTDDDVEFPAGDFDVTLS